MKSSILDQLRERSCSPVHPKSVPLADLSNVENRKVIILTMSAEIIAEFNCLILKLFWLLQNYYTVHFLHETYLWQVVQCALNIYVHCRGNTVLFWHYISAFVSTSLDFGWIFIGQTKATSCFYPLEYLIEVSLSLSEPNQIEDLCLMVQVRRDMYMFSHEHWISWFY